MSDAVQEIRAALFGLLHSIQRGDIEAYQALVSKELTCFEPETSGQRVEGLEFHLFLTRNLPPPRDYHLEVVNPVIKASGGLGYATYTVLVQRAHGQDVSISTRNETRIFERQQGQWRMVHFHRSSLPG